MLRVLHRHNTYFWIVPQDVLLQDVVLAHLACTHRLTTQDYRMPVLEVNEHQWGCNLKAGGAGTAFLSKLIWLDGAPQACKHIP